MEFSEHSTTQEFDSAFIQTRELNNVPDDSSYSDPISLADPLKLTESASVSDLSLNSMNSLQFCGQSSSGFNENFSSTLSFTLQSNNDFKEESKQGSKMVSTID